MDGHRKNWVYHVDALPRLPLLPRLISRQAVSVSPAQARAAQRQRVRTSLLYGGAGHAATRLVRADLNCDLANRHWRVNRSGDVGAGPPGETRADSTRFISLKFCGLIAATGRPLKPGISSPMPDRPVALSAVGGCNGRRPPGKKRNRRSAK